MFKKGPNSGTLKSFTKLRGDDNFTGMKPTLKIFVAEKCPGCGEALTIAHHARQTYADHINVEIINMADTEVIVPEAVFAAPTFMLDDCIVSLGNPSLQEVAGWVAQATTIQAEPCEQSFKE